MNTAVRVRSIPAGTTVPAGGEYVMLPDTEAWASSCAAPRAWPRVMSAGLARVTVGMARAIDRSPLPVLAPSLASPPKEADTAPG